MPAKHPLSGFNDTRFPLSKFKGPILMFASAVLFSATDIIIKVIGPAYRVWDIAFFRFGGGLVLMITLFGWFGNPFKGDNTRLLIVRGICGALAFVSLVTAIHLLPLSSAIVLMYTFPAFAALFSALLYGERVSLFQLACIFGTLSGVAVLLGFCPKGHLLGETLGLLAGMFAGIAVCVITKLRETNGPVIIYFYFCLVGALMVFPAFIAGPRLPTTGRGLILVLALVVLLLVAQLLMNYGFKYCRSWEGGLFLSSEAFFTSVAGICFLGDSVTWRFWIGGSLILGCAVLMNTAAATSRTGGKQMAGTVLLCISNGK
jgi:drug/metabolite transporter (DMT)-like permease